VPWQDVNSAELTGEYLKGAEQAKTALKAAVDEAQEFLSMGNAAVTDQDWESAIGILQKGLKVQGTHDDELMGMLRSSLESAMVAMGARNEARTQAEELLGKIIYERFCIIHSPRLPLLLCGCFLTTEKSMWRNWLAQSIG
jgi:hypothetical protein